MSENVQLFFETSLILCQSQLELIMALIRLSCLSILFLSYVLLSNMHQSFCILVLKLLLMILWILQDAHVLVQGHAHTLPVILQGPDITHGKLRCCIYVNFSLGSSGEFSL